MGWRWGEQVSLMEQINVYNVSFNSVDGDDSREKTMKGHKKVKLKQMHVEQNEWHWLSMIDRENMVCMTRKLIHEFTGGSKNSYEGFSFSVGFKTFCVVRTLFCCFCVSGFLSSHDKNISMKHLSSRNAEKIKIPWMK